MITVVKQILKFVRPVITAVTKHMIRPGTVITVVTKRVIAKAH